MIFISHGSALEAAVREFLVSPPVQNEDIRHNFCLCLYLSDGRFITSFREALLF